MAARCRGVSVKSVNLCTCCVREPVEERRRPGPGPGPGPGPVTCNLCEGSGRTSAQLAPCQMAGSTNYVFGSKAKGTTRLGPKPASPLVLVMPGARCKAVITPVPTKRAERKTQL
ncbi:hypothetical protein EYF80_042622 [Liparis tanakae]|uniref:Uncharacterized protein n=1 Tax=Liparis tanakae TaxID=230148 RepID=A0A4Z2G1Y5_9TELE|nr:hypothetical protein EYF80_042622 [Liparis tanakae]